MDPLLVIRAQHGDHEAFARLAVESGGRLHAVAHRILRDVQLAEDATQQALVSIWQHLPTLRDPARFEAWSHRLLVNACRDEARRIRRTSARVRWLSDDHAQAPDPLGLIQDRDQLERGFRHLSIDHRAVLVLSQYLGLSIEEVAETLGIPAGTVRSRLHHAARAMRAALEADARSVHPEVVR